MTADSTSSTSFNVEHWLKGTGASSFIADFTGHGYVTYERCVNLSEDDLRAIWNNDRFVRMMIQRVKDLGKFTEEDTVKLLSVSTRNKCTVCIGSCFFWSTFVCMFELSSTDVESTPGCSTKAVRE